MAEFTLFDTPIGRCAIVWTERGLAGVLLPGAHDKETRASVKARFPKAREASPPAGLQRTVDAIVALLRGESTGLTGLATLPIDMEDLPPFARRVYEVARTIPPGQTLSYGEVAERLGKPGSARAVGQALGRNPFAIVVPCHRVLAAGGHLGGFSAPGGVATKVQLLALESAHVAESRMAKAGEGPTESAAATTERAARPADEARESTAEVAAEVAEAAEEMALEIDLEEALLHLRNADKALARLIDRVGPFGMRVAKTQSLFAALARAIVYQQLTGKAAATIFRRVQALFPGAAGGLTADGLLRVSDDKLREAGLSRSKLLSLRDLAKKMVDGHLPSIDDVHAMEDDAIVEKLTEVRGIGRWTAEMLLMFRLGRPDVLPVDDYGIRKGFAAAFGQPDLPSRDALEKRGARWKPYRTVASWYLWRAAELEKKRNERRTAKEPSGKKSPAKEPAGKKSPAKEPAGKKSPAKGASPKRGNAEKGRGRKAKRTKR
jgi:O-6-methylguanine DNA methyltransferase